MLIKFANVFHAHTGNVSVTIEEQTEEQTEEHTASKFPQSIPEQYCNLDIYIKQKCRNLFFFNKWILLFILSKVQLLVRIFVDLRRTSIKAKILPPVQGHTSN